MALNFAAVALAFAFPITAAPWGSTCNRPHGLLNCKCQGNAPCGGLHICTMGVPSEAGLCTLDATEIQLEIGLGSESDGAPVIARAEKEDDAMTKRKKQKLQQEAEQKFERAHRRFEAAEQEYLLIREQGKQHVEKAQLEADRKLTKVHEQLEKRSRALSRAEENLLSIRGKTPPDSPPESVSRAADASSSPEYAAEAIQQLQARRAGSSGNGIAVPDGV